MRTHLTHYLTPAIAAVAAAASIASVTVGQTAGMATATAIRSPPGEERRLDAALRRQNAQWLARLQEDRCLRHALESRRAAADRRSRHRQGHARPARHHHDRTVRPLRSVVGMAGRPKAATAASSISCSKICDSAIGHEYQLIDDERHADAKIGPHRQTAALYDVLPAQNRALKPAGEWNQSRVVSNGTTVEHYLNGTKVLTYELDSPALRAAIAKSKFKDIARFGKLQNGFILLQDHGDRVWYRNIKIKRLPASGTKTSAAATAPGTKGVQVVANDSGKRVDITIDGKPFTSYIYPDTIEEAGALSDSHVGGTVGDARLPARAAAARARRPSAPRRPLVQPWRRERSRLLEQLLRHSRPIARRRWARSVTSASSRPRAAPIAVTWPSRWTG